MPQILRYHAVASQLPKLPPEVVHQIISDITLIKLLELISTYDLPYLENCISSHFQLGRVFPPTFLTNVKEYFTLYLRLRCLKHHTPFPHFPSLNHDATTYLRTQHHSVNIDLMIKAEIIQMLMVYAPLRCVLDADQPNVVIPHSTTWNTGTAAELKRLFDLIDAAEERLNATKSRQLKQMAELIQQYPGMLRARGDWSQERRSNEQHVVKHLLHLSQRMLRRQILSGSYVARSVFAPPQLYLVPYDRLLRLFLKVTSRYTPAPIAKASGKGVPHLYPPEMGVVLDGMNIFYFRPGDCGEIIFRTKYTKYSEYGLDVATGSHQPCFSLDQTGRTRDIDLSLALLPAAEAELVWLQAFLKVCNYMSEMSEEWKNGQTVGEYWRTHV